MTGSAADLLKSLHERLSNVNLEKEVLAHCVYVAEDQIEILTNLDVKHFSDHNHAKLFEIIFDMFRSRLNISADAVEQMLILKAKTIDIEDLKTIIATFQTIRLKDTVFNSLYVIKELYRNRVVYSEILTKATLMFNENEPIDTIIEHISLSLISVESTRSEKSVENVVTNVVDSILSETETEQGLKTGIDDIDTQYGGIKPDRYITIGAESGAGKTAILTDYIDRLCIRHSEKIAILFFSMEMSEDRIIKRIISRKTNIPVQKLEQKMQSLSRIERDLVKAAGDVIKRFPLEIIYDTLTPTQMRSRVRKFALENPDKHLIIMLDHIGLVTGKTDDLRVNTIRASEACKSFCVNYKATTFVLTQFTKEIDAMENRRNYHRPHMGYIMESGRIRQDSDIVMLLWRPETRFPTIPYAGDPQWKTEGKLIILNEKNRDGQAPTDMILSHKIEINQVFNNGEIFS